MSWRIAGALAVMVLCLNRPVALAQGWSADVSTGRIVYDPLAGEVSTSSVAGGVQHEWPSGAWIFGSGAGPVNEGGVFWGAAGAGGRVARAVSAHARTYVGADVSADAFLFRDRVVALSGTGATFEASPFVRVTSGRGALEGYGGWRGHTIAIAGMRESRGVFETGARADYGEALRVGGNARWVRAPEGTFPFVGGTVSYEGSRGDVWGRVGRWLSADMDDVVLGAGAALRLGLRTTLWGSVRQDAPDPLYWNPSRRTWSIGVTQRLGRAAPPLLPVPAVRSGDAVIRLRADDAPAGAVSIAGDFNAWQAVPMQREGREWVLRLPLTAGVYNYAFRSADGEWFVPASTPGRRDDGWGGHVAVLVVN